jgi:hypothetical protein
MSNSFIPHGIKIRFACACFQSNTPATGTTITANMHVSTQETSIQTDNRDESIQVYKDYFFFLVKLMKYEID